MATKNSSRSTWRKIALGSLLLNLFLSALTGGHLWRREFQAETPEVPFLASALANAEASLAPSDAAAFDAVIQRDLPRYADAVQQLSTARTGLDNAIAAEPFDQEGARQAFATWQASWGTLLADIRGTLVEALAQVSPEGRQKMVAERRKAASALAKP